MARPRPEDLLAVAHLVRAHGIHGEVSGILLAPPVLDVYELLEGQAFQARNPDGRLRPGHLKILALRPHQERWLFTIEGIETMTDAEALRQVDLCLARADLPPLPEGWFWENDLQSCHVVDRSLGDLGGVQGLNTDFFQPQLEIVRPDGRRVMIPWVKAFVTEVNLDAGLIHVDLPAGFPGISSEE
jgi:16S rRNA processing protein RimM